MWLAVLSATVSHKDHSKSIPQAIKNGLCVYSCSDVQSIHSEVKVLQKGFKTKIGNFKVQPIPLHHNVECIGFLIIAPDGQRILFATDTNRIPYKFTNLNHILVESNYWEDLIIDNMCNDDFNVSASENHLEINDTIDFLRHNYSSSLMTICLIHLSHGNADEKYFKQKVQDELGFNNVFVAKKGVEIPLEICEF
jgi:ribonuclease BN (tRNA processing enzyme)